MADPKIVQVPRGASAVELRVRVHDAITDARLRDAWLASPLPHTLGFERAAAYFGVRLETGPR